MQLTTLQHFTSARSSLPKTPFARSFRPSSMASPDFKTSTPSVSGPLKWWNCMADSPADRDLLNTLYDGDHFRIALGQLSTAKHLIEQVCRDYVRLIKYAQS